MRSRPGQEPNHKMEEVHSRLIFTRNPYTDSALYLVATFIAERRFSAAHSHHISQVSAFGNGGKFSGLIVYSTVEGQLVGGRKFLNGVPTHQIRMDGHEHGEACNHEYEHEHSDACAHDHADDSVCETLGEYFSFAFAVIPEMTRAYGYGEGWCNDCGKTHWGLCWIWIDPIVCTPCYGPCNGTVANCTCYLYCLECRQLWINCDGHGPKYVMCSSCGTYYWDNFGHTCSSGLGGSGGGNPGGGNGSGGTGSGMTDAQYRALGNEAFDKIRSDLVSKNVNMQEAKVNSAGELVLTATGIGVNTNGIITSCVSFMNNVDNLAINFGRGVAGLGIGIGITQTCIAYSDGNITAGTLNLISTALATAGFICAFVPGAQVVAGVLGVTSCVIGLIASFVSDHLPKEIHIQLEDGTNIYLQFVQVNLA